MLNEPLGLPKGSVRAIIALGVVGSAIYMLATSKIAVEDFTIIAGAVMAFYFVVKEECK